MSVIFTFDHPHLNRQNLYTVYIYSISYSRFQPTMTGLHALFLKYPTHVWRGVQGHSAGTKLPTGYEALDRALGGGWPVGSLVEILAQGPGLGELSLLMPAVAACTRGGQGAAWLPAGSLPYAPALAQAGVDLRRLLLVSTHDDRRRLWAAEQCLRSGTCAAAIIAPLAQASDRNLRRLKLAAATGGGIAFLLRNTGAMQQASPASLRLVVEREAQDIQITLLKCRGQAPRSLRLQSGGARH
jgi:protein ImuA